MDYGIEIKRLRNRTGLTQEELAKKVGIHRIVINKIERGSRNPSEKLFVTILNSMGYRLIKKIIKNNSNKT